MGWTGLIPRPWKPSWHYSKKSASTVGRQDWQDRLLCSNRFIQICNLLFIYYYFLSCSVCWWKYSLFCAPLILTPEFWFFHLPCKCYWYLTVCFVCLSVSIRIREFMTRTHTQMHTLTHCSHSDVCLISLTLHLVLETRMCECVFE